MESRLAALTLDADDLSKLSAIPSRSDLPSSFQPHQIAQLATALPSLFNVLNVRRAIIPAANGHLSARALARYYAALADGGKVPPPHSSASMPQLGSHPHIPKFSSQKAPKYGRRKQTAIPSINRANDVDENLGYEYESKNATKDGHIRLSSESSSSGSSIGKMADSDRDSSLRSHHSGKVFGNPKIIDEFLGTGEYENLVLPSGIFGLGFKKFPTKDGSSIVFGHSGMGGSTGFCDVRNRFSIAVTLNKMSLGGVTGKIVHLVCSELNIPVPEDYLRFAAAEAQSNLQGPLIN